ncbi:hypothetical protein Tco_1195398 [Tanacetum coccineum]
MSATRQGMNSSAIEQLIAQRVANSMTAYKVNRASKNEAHNETSGSAGGVEHAVRNCSYKEFLTYKPHNFKGIEGAFGLTRCSTPSGIPLRCDCVKLSKHEINVSFVNSLPEKWLTFSQGLRNANHTQTLDLADIHGRFVYKDNLIQRRYSDTKKALITTPSSTLISTAFFSNNVIQDFQENFDDEVHERSSEEYLRDLDIKYHEKRTFGKPQMFYKKGKKKKQFPLLKKQMKILNVTNVATKVILQETRRLRLLGIVYSKEERVRMH